MRYADSPTTEVEVLVDAPAERVWLLVTDIDLPARFSNEFKGAEWIDGQPPPRLGARFRGRNEHPAIGAWETTSVVVTCEPGRSFGWDVESGDSVAASWRFELEPDGGGCRLRQWARMGPGSSGLTAAIEARPDREERIIERRLGEWRRNMQATVEGIKARAESGRTPS
jgi:uncharacterized protein YndB with AHSA1/START domain